MPKGKPVDYVPGSAPVGWTRIEIDDVPPSLNQYLRSHWAVKRRLRQGWGWKLRYALSKAGVHPAKAVDVKISMNFTITRPRRLDPDGAYGSVKPILDAARDIGLIKNDSPRWLDLGVSQMIGEPRTVIEFRETNSCEDHKPKTKGA